MGFYKRFITKDSILSQKSFEDIEMLLDADSLILDNWSSNFFKRFDEKYTEYQNKRNLIIDEFKYKSSPPDVSSLNGYYISNILINLKLDPNWTDIQLCADNLNTDIPKDISGNFNLLCDFFIKLIENKMENGL